MEVTGIGMRELSVMKKSYLTTAFQKTAKNYPAQTETLNVAFDARLSQLRRENADAPRKAAASGKPDPAGYRGI